VRFFRTLFQRSVLGVLVAAMLGGFAASPAQAYGGPENWQTAFAGTGVNPGTGVGFGFWGWCAFGGGVTAGNTGDCQVTQYFHSPTFRVTCHQSINVTSWDGSGGTFVLLSGTTTTHPASAASLCGIAGGLPPSFNSPFNTAIPAAAGHYNLTSSFLFPGSVGELQIQVTQIP
jgi:hypothetical protein